MKCSGLPCLKPAAEGKRWNLCYLSYFFYWFLVLATIRELVFVLFLLKIVPAVSGRGVAAVVVVNRRGRVKKR